MFNSFGGVFKFSTFGESHGKAIGCLIDGCPAGIKISEDEIQIDLDRRKPSSSKFVTQRNEDDKVEILSGVFNGKTTGTSIGLIIHNQDQRSKDYNDIKDKFRPSHADYTYFKKYGIRDYRGGGRSSARETAMRVAAGSIAKKIIKHNSDIKIISYVKQIGNIEVKKINLDLDFINSNSLFCPCEDTIQKWEEYLMKIRKDGSSIGALIETVVQNMPVGLGEPIYYKLDSKLAEAMMTINAVKGFEIGSGFDCINMNGENHADEMFIDKNGQEKFTQNNNGGIIGGISSGQDLLMRIAIKPTSSILKARSTIDINGNNTEIITKGRHDPCVGIRAVPICEAMTAIVLADMILLNKTRFI
jgi:chorismate synthase